MTSQQVARGVRKRWGAKGAFRAYGASSSEAERKEAAAERDRLKARREAIDAEVKERLAATDWYVRLTAERREVSKALDVARGRAVHYRYSVGSDEGWCYRVEGQGDSWSAAFANADAKRAR